VKIFGICLYAIRMKIFRFIVLFLIFMAFQSCKKFDAKSAEGDWDTICVTATAYNSLSYQTQGDPRITAWGDTLKPGMNAIAVSRDLLRMGLEHNSKVKIEGFDSVFLVKDKMHFRWRKRIDIYMGENEEKANNFGRKKLNISYIFKKPSAIK
jgi:3D (Asp-Asp-Asp) domain-containing protein